MPQLRLDIIPLLVGGWTNPSENIVLKLGSSSPSFGVKIPERFELPHLDYVNEVLYIPGSDHRISEPSTVSIGSSPFPVVVVKV